MKELIKKDDFIILDEDYMEAYIPKFYFEGKLAADQGSSILIFGLFNIRFFKKDKPGELKTFNYPSMIVTFPSDIESKQLQLVSGENGIMEEYYVLKYYRGDRVLESSIPSNSSNVELFIDILTRGKIPVTVPYSEVLNIWRKNLEINNVHLGVSSTVLEVIVSEIYRNKKKPEEAFRKVVGTGKVSEYEYSTATIREICSRNSTFSAITFEDFDSMLTSSINISKFNKEETESPIEKIIKM